MKYFHGIVTINNGRYDRRFNFQVIGSSINPASGKALRLAEIEFRKLLPGKRLHISAQHLDIQAGGLVADRQAAREYCQLM
jgi:hypothetical protein